MLKRKSTKRSALQKEAEGEEGRGGEEPESNIFIPEDGSQDHHIDVIEAGERRVKKWVSPFSEGKRRKYRSEDLAPYPQHCGVRRLLQDVRPAVRMK